MAESVSLDSVVVVSPDQISADLAGEVAMLNLASGVYFGLDTVGAWIWNRIKEPTRVREIRDAMLRHFDVKRPECERDLLRLLADLQTHGLIEVRDE